MPVFFGDLSYICIYVLPELWNLERPGHFYKAYTVSTGSHNWSFSRI